MTENEAQFGFVGVALALVTWFSGAAICVLIGRVPDRSSRRTPGGSGSIIRGGESPTRHIPAGAPSGAAAAHSRAHSSRRLRQLRRLVTTEGKVWLLVPADWTTHRRSRLYARYQ